MQLCPTKKKRQHLHFTFIQTTLFYLERFLNKLADDQSSTITRGSIYHFKRMYMQPFTTVVDWAEIQRLMEVSTMFYICRYRVFTWWGRTSDTIVIIPCHLHMQNELNYEMEQ